MAGRRLSKEKRRVQLLDTAAGIVRAEGAEALTLARVAEQAGVTKPIAYEHFGTRTGLLKALYQRIDEQQTEAARTAIAENAETVRETVTILAEAYVDCVLRIGQGFGAITAALSGNAEMAELLHAGRQRYARLLAETLQRHTSSSRRNSMVLMLGVVGAAEVLAGEVGAARLERLTAIEAIAALMLGAVAVPAGS